MFQDLWYDSRGIVARRDGSVAVRCPELIHIGLNRSIERAYRGQPFDVSYHSIILILSARMNTFRELERTGSVNVTANAASYRHDDVNTANIIRDVRLIRIRRIYRGYPT